MKKNSMSPRFFLPVFLLLLAAALPVFSKERPNIVLFFIDFRSAGILVSETGEVAPAHVIDEEKKDVGALL